jgi:hypothetical protein
VRLGGKCQAQWGTGGPGIRGRVVYRGWGKLQGKTVGAKAGEEGRDIARVRQGERSSGAVVVNGETKEFRGDGMGFHVVEEGKDWDKKVEVRAVVGQWT